MKNLTITLGWQPWNKIITELLYEKIHTTQQALLAPRNETHEMILQSDLDQYEAAKDAMEQQLFDQGDTILGRNHAEQILTEEE